MHTWKIIKKAFYLPFRAYKGFILVTFLFFISEIVNSIVNQIEIGNLTPLTVLITFVIDIAILGICIAIVYHYIYSSFDIREVSLTTTAKAGFKDEMIEIYYYMLAIGGTIILSLALGIYHNISSIMDSVTYIDSKLDTVTLPKLLSLLSPDSYHHLASSVIATLIIFIILFAICFSYCSFAKIRLKETGDVKESVNFVKLSKIIKSKGIKKYLNFVILNFLVFSAVLIIMRTLEYYFVIGSIISALAEAFALFFILDSYSLFYYSDNIN
ncbi:hypothetical protein [uncultured Methanobrevibacter sp.]|uniref:hypothetical protein n=1 Tax=uncultured Methanobrevibacter sp. TaxID=253161 RepID=UPI002638939E|nr:hypothetical protein [uncultured Methanobrevibacter sp.]